MGVGATPKTRLCRMVQQAFSVRQGEDAIAGSVLVAKLVYSMLAIPVDPVWLWDLAS